MLLAKRGPPRVNEGSPSCACMQDGSWRRSGDSANGDGRLEDFDGDNCDGRFAYATIHCYLDCGVYPKDFSKSDKLALRKRAKYFCTKGADLYYVGGSSSKFTVLVFKGICSVT